MDGYILGTSGQDLAVRHDYRGKGLSSQTGNCTKELRTRDGIPFSFFVTRSPILLRRYKSSKDLRERRPRFPFDLVNLTRVRDIDLHFKHMPMENQNIIKLGAKTLYLYNKISSRKKKSNLNVTIVDHFDSDINIFL
jgi:hypothetical protein